MVVGADLMSMQSQGKVTVWNLLQVVILTTWKKPLQIQHSLQGVKMTSCGNEAS